MQDKEETVLFCSNSEGAMDGDACSTAHDNAIKQGYVGLWVLCNQVVHGVLVSEEAARMQRYFCHINK